MSVFGIALLLSQVDFFVIRSLADFIVSTFATIKFMEKKTVDTAYTPLVDAVQRGVRGAEREQAAAEP
eukprot:3934970-Rhodomonas_salina.2